MQMFKVCCANRGKKVSILISNQQNVYYNLVEKASIKLNVTGTKLVIEEDEAW